MSFEVDSLRFHPSEGTVLDTASLLAIHNSEHATLSTLLRMLGQPLHGLVVQGLNVELVKGRTVVEAGSAILPGPDGKLMVVASQTSHDCGVAQQRQFLLVARVETRISSHGASGLKAASHRVELSFATISWEALNPAKEVPVAYIDKDSGHVDRDICRLLFPDSTEVIDIVSRLTKIIKNQLKSEDADAQRGDGGVARRSLDAPLQLYLSSLQHTILSLRSRPMVSMERVRLMTDLARVVHTYFDKSRTMDLIGELYSAGYINQRDVRSMRPDRAAASRLYSEVYSRSNRKRSSKDKA